MAYSTSNPPMLIARGIGVDNGNLWVYKSEDAAADINTAGYFTDGYALGMRKNDIVFAIDTNASPIDLTIHGVVSADATNGVDLGDGTEVSGSDSD